MAPRKRGGRGISFIFCCFRNNDHPEITYRLRNDSSFALQTMEPALPMPPVEELDVMFSELVVSPRHPSQLWLGARRGRRGCGWFGLVWFAQPWACPSLVKRLPPTSTPSVSTEPVEKEKEESSITTSEGFAGALSGGTWTFKSSNLWQYCILSFPVQSILSQPESTLVCKNNSLLCFTPGIPQCFLHPDPLYSINVSLKISHTTPPVLDPLMKDIIT